MKTFIRLTLAILMATLLGSTLSAQGASDRQTMTRQQLAEREGKYIARQLALDDAITDKFVATYCAFQQEVWALGPRPKGRQQSATTDEQAQREIQNGFERGQKILDLRQKYYKEYSTFLSQKQIQRVYELEQYIKRRLSNRLVQARRVSHRGDRQAPVIHPNRE